ncbi:hypothetical protein [Sorangium sp. So ce1151]|uniref:hypothetical protein n=1 Tax=Sorangium sp. So ce1151 TaxID=3133332 RepID=UPI003F6155A5
MSTLVGVVDIDEHGGTAAASRYLLRARPRMVRHITRPPDWLEADQSYRDLGIEDKCGLVKIV